MLRWHFGKWLLVLLLIRGLLELTPIPDAHDFFGVLVPLLLAGLIFYYIGKHSHLLREFLVGVTLVMTGQLLDWLEIILHQAIHGSYLFIVDDFLVSSGFFMLGLALIKLINNREQLINTLNKEITFRRELQQTTEYLARHDEMTKLGNRRALFQQLENARFDGEGGTLLYLDVNHFKQVNDRMGHQAGDDLLKEIARLISHNHPHSYRLGGDEFVILLSGDDESVGQHIHTLHQAATPLEQQYGISLSIGQQRYQPSDLADPDQVLAKADQSMYANKQHWRRRMTKNH